MKKMNLNNLLVWQKRLGFSVGMLCFIIYMLFVYYTNQNEVVFLPEKETPIVFYSNQTGDNLKAIVKAAIKNAKTSISLMIFSLTDYEIIDLLKEKADDGKGVQVLVICDAQATPDIEWKLGSNVTLCKRRDKGLMHQKLLVIDHSQTYLGSTNFTRESFMLHANLLIGIDSAPLAAMIEKKAYSIQKKEKWKAPVIKISELGVKREKRALDFYFLPDEPVALDRLIKTIESAKKSLKVAMYTFTHPKLAQALIDAHNRGVTVEVVMDNDSAKQTSRKVFLQLKREKVNVALSARAGLLHYKFVIVDDELLATGSANWTKAAFTTNDDNICFISSLTDVQKAKLKEIWAAVKKESKPSFTSSKS